MSNVTHTHTQTHAQQEHVLLLLTLTQSLVCGLSHNSLLHFSWHSFLSLSTTRFHVIFDFPCHFTPSTSNNMFLCFSSCFHAFLCIITISIPCSLTHSAHKHITNHTKWDVHTWAVTSNTFPERAQGSLRPSHLLRWYSANSPSLPCSQPPTPNRLHTAALLTGSLLTYFSVPPLTTTNNNSLRTDPWCSWTFTILIHSHECFHQPFFETWSIKSFTPLFVTSSFNQPTPVWSSLSFAICFAMPNTIFFCFLPEAFRPTSFWPFLVPESAFCMNTFAISYFAKAASIPMVSFEGCCTL